MVVLNNTSNQNTTTGTRPYKMARIVTRIDSPAVMIIIYWKRIRKVVQIMNSISIASGSFLTKKNMSRPVGRGGMIKIKQQGRVFMIALKFTVDQQKQRSIKSLLGSSHVIQLLLLICHVQSLMTITMRLLCVQLSSVHLGR